MLLTKDILLTFKIFCLAEFVGAGLESESKSDCSKLEVRFRDKGWSTKLIQSEHD